MDAIIVALLPKLGVFLVSNKFTILFVIYMLEKGARLTKTTLDDSIITFLKHIVMRIFGKGKIIDAKYEYFKQNGVINNFVGPDTMKHFEEEFLSNFKNKEKQFLPDVKKFPMPQVKPIKSTGYSEGAKMANPEKYPSHKPVTKAPVQEEEINLDDFLK